ncbi:C39 family peptidase [Acetanaerobacterium elongatum]|uniref:Peptidase_C39 like family protein n=1 Tax=Acetanaerobacterium elongatum TaxID=258515 RepID=A0A1H0H5B6_9FIRM|nr:C39 family peptidase [Acetanaerobacterium elongatum]SDO14280.1 Peptidase_C39 like family protein [Acetanaerobacterium elongatum]
MAIAHYDQSSKITIYQQITNTSCAATCAAMCVNRSPETLQADGFNLGYANWSGIAQAYGYSVTNGTASLSGILTILASGYPVIVKVNTGSNEHWVVVTAFTGEENSPAASNFTCADPWTGESVTLRYATRYNGIYTTKYFS